MKKLENPAHKSLRRNEPLHIPFNEPVLLNDKKNNEKDKVKDIIYDKKGKPFIDIFDNAITKNNDVLVIAFSKYFSRINNSINNHYEIMSQYMWCFQASFIQISSVNTVLFSAFHKSLINIASALHLTKNGLWGPARPLIRQTLESLIIAKYCSVNHESEIYDLWLDGKQVSIGKVFKNLEKPNTDRFKSFWGSLSDLTHSSRYASQPNLDIKSNLDDLLLNLVWIEIVLECKYHLLISHVITKNMTYYEKRYSEESYLRVQKLKLELKNHYLNVRKEMSNDAKQFIVDFRTKWVVK